MRADRQIYDKWGELGNKGWEYDNIFKYFLKSENNRMSNFATSKYHQTGGYLHIGEAFQTPLGQALVDAGNELGYAVDDLNGKCANGFMITQRTILNGKRCSTAKAFLQTVRHHDNLHISIKAHVTRIIIDPNIKKAISVEFTSNSINYRTRAKNEIILSAGAINSPQILMLSGIGPKEELDKHNIAIIKDLDVGKHLQDHIGFTGLLFSLGVNGGIKLDELSYQNVLNYSLNNKGPLTGGCEAVALFKTKYAENNLADIQIIQTPLKANVFGGKLYTAATGLKQSFYDATYGKIGNNDTFMLMPVLVTPHSIGSIKLKSSDPFEAPMIDPNYFSNPLDIDILIEGIKLTLATVKTKAFEKFKINMPDFEYTNCKNIEKYSDEYWRCAIQEHSQSAYHASGTCKMGPANDKSAVVDSHLRVHGISGLRVIDASIMPTIVNANLNAPVIMIGEYGAELIKEDWNDQINTLNELND